MTEIKNNYSSNSIISKKPSPSYDDFYKAFLSSSTGYCFFEIEHDNIVLKNSNHVFDVFESRYNKKFKPIHETETFVDVINSKGSLKMQIPVNDENGFEVIYNLTFHLLPLPGEKKIVSISISEISSMGNISNEIFNCLTKRELEIIKHIFQCETNRFIAYTLGITEGTVKKITNVAYNKLNVSSRGELIKLMCYSNFKEDI